VALEQIGVPGGVRLLNLVEPAVVWSTGLLTLRRDPAAPMVSALMQEAELLAGLFAKTI